MLLTFFIYIFIAKRFTYREVRDAGAGQGAEQGSTGAEARTGLGGRGAGGWGQPPAPCPMAGQEAVLKGLPTGVLELLHILQFLLLFVEPCRWSTPRLTPRLWRSSPMGAVAWPSRPQPSGVGVPAGRGLLWVMDDGFADRA